MKMLGRLEILRMIRTKLPTKSVVMNKPTIFTTIKSSYVVQELLFDIYSLIRLHCIEVFYLIVKLYHMHFLSNSCPALSV